jgi:hypothetical protein
MKFCHSRDFVPVHLTVEYADDIRPDTAPPGDPQAGYVIVQLDGLSYSTARVQPPYDDPFDSRVATSNYRVTVVTPCYYVKEVDYSGCAFRVRCWECSGFARYQLATMERRFPTRSHAPWSSAAMEGPPRNDTSSYARGFRVAKFGARGLD